ncbi:MAG: DMT family transporter [Rhodanobacteraceae bacterium]
MKHARLYTTGFLLLMGFDTLAQISFKHAGTHALPVVPDLAWLRRLFDAPWIYGAIIGYIGAFFTWMTLLKHAPIGPAFAASHLEIISVMLLSVWLFDEPLTTPRVLGALFILAGIACLALAEDRVQTSPTEPADSKAA